MLISRNRHWGAVFPTESDTHTYKHTPNLAVTSLHDDSSRSPPHLRRIALYRLFTIIFALINQIARKSSYLAVFPRSFLRQAGQIFTFSFRFHDHYPAFECIGIFTHARLAFLFASFFSATSVPLQRTSSCSPCTHRSSWESKLSAHTAGDGRFGVGFGDRQNRQPWRSGYPLAAGTWSQPHF